MKRKTSNIPTRIYKYGLPFGPDKNCADLVDQQIYLAHKFRNKMVEIEKFHLDQYRSEELKIGNLSLLSEEVDKLKEVFDEVKEAINLDKQKRRARRADPTLLGKKKAAQTALKAAREKLKETKKKIRESKVLEEFNASLKEKTSKRKSEARAEAGLYWGSYLRVEKAIEDRNKQVDPEFKRYSGKGSIAVQLQGGLSADRLFSGKDRRLQIDPVPDEVWYGSRSYRRKHTKTKLRIRVGSLPNKAPVWAAFSMILHRPLPKDANIKWAWVQRRKLGLKWKWELCLQMESSSFFPPSKEGSSACAIDLGWRKVDEDLTLRVGYLVGSDGHQEEILLPGVIRDKLNHSKGLRSLQDKLYNQLKEKISSWKKDQEELPSWFKEETSHLHMWKSAKRMLRLLSKWKENRTPGDEEIVQALEDWRRTYHHLYGWESNQNSRARGRRKDYYRKLAVRLCKRYNKLILEEFNISKVAKVKGDGSDLEKLQRHQRTVAAPSEFRDAVLLAASNQGSTVVFRPAAYTTVTCHHCGGMCEWDKGKYLFHSCEHCGIKWDQDANAAKNLLFSKPKN